MTKEEAIKLLNVLAEHESGKYLEALYMSIKALEQEPKIGHWEFPSSATKMICTCSCCGGNGSAFGKDKFCRNCGAKMTESEDSNDATM